MFFVGNQNIELEANGTRTWTPVHLSYAPRSRFICSLKICVFRDISPTSETRVEIHRTTRFLFWKKRRQENEVIDLQAIFDEYWDSTKHEFTVLSQS